MFDKARGLELGHLIANRRGGIPDRIAIREEFRANRLAVGNMLTHDQLQHLLLPLRDRGIALAMNWIDSCTSCSSACGNFSTLFARVLTRAWTTSFSDLYQGCALPILCTVLSLLARRRALLTGSSSPAKQASDQTSALLADALPGECAPLQHDRLLSRSRWSQEASFQDRIRRADRLLRTNHNPCAAANRAAWSMSAVSSGPSSSASSSRRTDRSLCRSRRSR